MRGLDVLQKLGVDGRILQMEGAKDPDEYIIKYGSGRFNLLVDNAISLIEFKSKMFRNNFNLENATDKIKFLKEIAKLIAMKDNKLERQIYIEKIADQNQISKEALYAEVNKLVYDNSFNEKILDKSKPILKKETKSENEISSSIIKRENMILYLLINNFKEAGQIIKENISKEDFKVEINKKIFEQIFNVAQNDTEDIYKSLSNIEDEEFQSALSSVVVSDYEITSVEKCIEDVIGNYSRDKLNSRKLEIINKLRENNISEDEMKKLENELNEIITKLARKK